MRRLILFSMPSEEVLERLFPHLFPADLPRKVLACMPSDGALEGRRYELFRESWQRLTREHVAELLVIDNSVLDATEERAKLQMANILLITGGNPCVLLRNLRRSGLDKAILEFARKDSIVLAGYSAGAMIYTPSIALSTFGPWQDDNVEVRLTNFEALHLVEYEIIPHYTDDMSFLHKRYEQMAKHSVRTLRDDEFIIHEW